MLALFAAGVVTTSLEAHPTLKSASKSGRCNLYSEARG
jgi:hypothetical protein